MSDKISYDDLLYLFEVTELVDDTGFFFDDDPDDNWYFIGYCTRTFDGSSYEKPYWVGVCDVVDGCEFATAKEFFEAKVFDGKSIKERWAHLVIFQFGGIEVEDFMKLYGEEILSNRQK